MRESTTYQAILREGWEEGRISGARRMLFRQGTKRFGEPDATTVAALEAIQDIDRLEALGERILDPDLHDWDKSRIIKRLRQEAVDLLKYFRIFAAGSALLRPFFIGHSLTNSILASTRRSLWAPPPPLTRPTRP